MVSVLKTQVNAVVVVNLVSMVLIVQTLARTVKILHVTRWVDPAWMVACLGRLERIVETVIQFVHLSGYES